MKEGLSKFLLKKKIFSLILVASIIFGMLPTTASALAPGVQIKANSVGADNKTIQPTKLEDGQIWVDKSVTVTNSSTGEFEITLSAAGQKYMSEQPNKVDVVLVLDTSKSMSDNDSPKFGAMKAAAINAVNTLLASNLDNRVAIVTFNNEVIKKADFTEKTGKNTLISTIRGLGTNFGTDTQKAFLVAQNTISNRIDETRKPVIILISDGKPSFYHTTLTDDNDEFRVGNGDDKNTNGTYVWWTVKQAMEAKTKISGLEIYTIGIGVENNALAVATLQPDEENTRGYRGGDTFDHKYWTKCLLSDPTEAEIKAALNEIVNTTLSEQPHNSDIIIEDVIGDRFEVVGTPGVGLSQSGNKITWTIDGDTFETMASGSTSLASAKVKTISFRVKISEDAAVGTYYTNDTKLTKATFTVPQDNDYYNELDYKENDNIAKDENGNVTVSLKNTGWLTLEEIPATEVTISITKIVSGPVTEGENNIFTFDVYSSSEGGTPLNESLLSITVTGDGSNSDTISLYLPWDAFNESGEATLYVQENDSSPNDYWNYDNLERKEVTFTKTVTTNTVQFTNTYTPPGTISVTKIWSTGNNTDWPDNVGSVIVELIEAAPDNTSTTPDSITINTTLDAITLTKANPTGFFKDFVKKEDCSYFLNEVTVDGYSTYMYATKGGIDFETGEVTFNNDNSAAITIVNTGNAPAISITKEVVDGSTKTLSGGKATFIYELVVTNTGNTTLENVEVEDVMNGPSGATFEYSDNTSTFVIGKMEPGDSESITYSVIVDKAGEYTNKATATCNECDPVSVTATATVNSEYVPPVTPPVTPPSGGGGGYTPSQGTVKVNYVDVNGNALADGDELTGMVGTDYSTSAKTIDGYTLTAVPENAEGTFVNGVIMVTYVYKAEETEIEIEEEEIPEGTPEEPIIDEEIPQGGEILPQTGLPIATLPELFGGALIALGLYFGRKAKEDEE